MKAININTNNCNKILKLKIPKAIARIAETKKVNGKNHATY